MGKKTMVQQIQLPKYNETRDKVQEEISQTQEESQNQKSEEEISSESINDGSHLDNINIECEAGEGVVEPAQGEHIGVNPDGTMTREAFFIAFKGAFNISSGLSGLKSLKIEESDEAARIACDSIYDIAQEVSYFRFLIMPSNVWIQRSMAIGAFMAPKCIMLKIELDARKAAKMRNVTPKEQQQKQEPQKEPEQPKYEDPLADFPKDAAGA